MYWLLRNALLHGVFNENLDESIQFRESVVLFICITLPQHKWKAHYYEASIGNKTCYNGTA